MTDTIRIFSYLPNPRVWKSLITAEFGNVKIKVIGDKPKKLGNWLWDFDAHEIVLSDLNSMEIHKREGKRGFKGKLYKTNDFLEKHPFGTVPAGFNMDGTIGIFESNSIMRAVARASKNTSLYGDHDPFQQSRIDSFLDVNLVFAREFQVYALEINFLSEYLHQRMQSAYFFYLDGIEKTLLSKKFIAGDKMTIADISFVCELAQFLRERDKKKIIKKQGYELISKNFEKDYPIAYNHLISLYNMKEFKNIMLDYLDKALVIKC